MSNEQLTMSVDSSDSRDYSGVTVQDSDGNVIGQISGLHAGGWIIDEKTDADFYTAENQDTPPADLWPDLDHETALFRWSAATLEQRRQALRDRQKRFYEQILGRHQGVSLGLTRGSGKTSIVTGMLNELQKYGVSIVPVPTKPKQIGQPHPDGNRATRRSQKK